MALDPAVAATITAITTLRRAVEWYADRAHYEAMWHEGGSATPAELDGGAKAREALATIDGLAHALRVVGG